MIGTRISHYDIKRHLGSGGMGDMYEATDSKLGRNVTIMFLPQAFSLHGRDSCPPQTGNRLQDTSTTL